MLASQKLKYGAQISTCNLHILKLFFFGVLRSVSPRHANSDRNGLLYSNGQRVFTIEEVFKRRVTNVVFMGMGEPMLNLEAVLEAHLCLNKGKWTIVCNKGSQGCL